MYPLLSRSNSADSVNYDLVRSENGWAEDIERFSNSCAPASLVKGGFFLRKKPLSIALPGYSYWRIALAQNEDKSMEEQRCKITAVEADDCCCKNIFDGATRNS
jgi:hypothetical protein